MSTTHTITTTVTQPMATCFSTQLKNTYLTKINTGIPTNVMASKDRLYQKITSVMIDMI